jgi:phosphate transport system substrate-binding protein
LRAQGIFVRALPSTVFAFMAWGACAAQQAALPSYTPAPLGPGVIRSWGDDAMRGTMTAWEQAFRKHHPEITFQDNLLGTATSMAGIITDTSDLSLMGRPATVNEVIGFEWVYRVKPLGIQVMNGSLKTEGRSPALAVLVSRNNPVQQISMAQLAAILGCPADAKPVTWAMAGATGTWSHRAVHAFVYDDQTGTGAFLQQAVLGTRDCWNWEIVREFKDKARSNGTIYPAAQQIADALKRDPDGLAVATLGFLGPQIKALPVSGEASAVALSPESVTAHTYPLARSVYIYIHRSKDQQVDPKVSEFLRFILSEEGQALVEQQGDFLKLNAGAAYAERKKLE